MISNNELVKTERPLFEKNYIETGGHILFLKWEETRDGSGSYQVDWDAVAQMDDYNPDFEEQLELQADNLTSCLMSWIESAKRFLK